MNARKKQHNNKDNNKNNNKEIARSKLELRGNRKMLISASHVPTSFANHNNGNNYVSTMNTVGKSVERNSITQKFHQHLKKNMKISNFNQLTGLTKQNHSRDYPDITRSKAMKKGFDARQSQGLERKRKISQVSIKKNKKLNAKKILQTQPHVDADSQSMEMLSPIQKLNDDCLRLVFDLLTLEERLKIEPVCKKWRSVNRSISWKVKGLYYPYVEPLSWRRDTLGAVYDSDDSTDDDDFDFDPQGPDYFRSSEALHVLKQRFTYVPQLLALCGKHLQELDLSAFTDSTILTKLKIHAFPNLIKLKLRIFNEWKPEHCSNLFEKMNKLESFYVTTDPHQRIPLELFQAISILTETLKELTIINFTYHQYSVENTFYAYLMDTGSNHDTSLAELIGLKSLRFLELKCFNIEECDLEILKDLNLETLIMARCDLIVSTPSDFLHILDYKNLKKLALGPFFKDITYIFKEIPKKLNNLRKMVLYKPSETENKIKTMSSHFSDKCEIIIAEDPAKLRGIINPWRGISL